MSKISIDKLKGISPRGKALRLPYENEQGKEEYLEFMIYPFTVKEKIHQQEMREELNKLDKDSKEFNNLSLDLTLMQIYDVLKKSVDGITLEYVRERIPTEWFEEILLTAYSFEGITKEDFKLAKKNYLSEATKK